MSRYSSTIEFQAIFSENSTSFGPVVESEGGRTCLGRLGRFPFVPTLRGERLGKAADFSFLSHNRAMRDGFVHQNVEEDSIFHTVDTGRLKGRYDQQGVGHIFQPLWHRRKPPKATTQAFQQKQEQERLWQMGRRKVFEQKKQQQAMQARLQRMQGRRRSHGEMSVEPAANWTAVGDIQLVTLVNSTVTASPKATDVHMKGTVEQYEKTWDKVNPKSAKTVRISQAYNYVEPTTREDDVIRSYLLASEGEPLPENAIPAWTEVEVAATGGIISVLMAAPSSRKSWHLWVHKIDQKIIFDKTDGSTIDTLSINETMQEIIRNEKKPKPPPQAARNALRVNNFIKLKLLQESKAENKTSTSTALVPESLPQLYRIFSIPPVRGSDKTGDVILVTRVEKHAKIEDKQLSICSLPEPEGKTQGEWKHALETQKGAILVTELRNNAHKFQRFVAQAFITSADEMKLAFVSKKSPVDPDAYSILSVQTHRTAELARQLGFTAEQGWGSVRAVVDYFREQEDGHYALVKDPQKQTLRVYRIDEGKPARVSEHEVSSTMRLHM